VIMDLPSRNSLQVIFGQISGLSVEHITLNLLEKSGDREGMAATGALAAAMGLSGPAAGMAMMSSEEMNESVAKANFKINDLNVTAILATWPFSEGDSVKLVGTITEGRTFVALAALDEERRIVSLYPHVSAGSFAHWARVLRYSLWVGVPTSTLMLAVVCLGTYGTGESFEGFLIPLMIAFVVSVLLVIFVGYRIGRRFSKFVRIAEQVFEALEWPDVRWVNLRKDAAANRLDGDPPGLGDTYFRY